MTTTTSNDDILMDIKGKQKEDCNEEIINIHNVNNTETWQKIIGFENYEISSLGRFRNTKTGSIQKGIVSKTYIRYSMKKDRVRYFYGYDKITETGEVVNFSRKSNIIIPYPETTIEEWKPVSGLEDFYEISSFGRLRNKITNYIAKGIIDKGGYIRYTLRENGKPRQKLAHRLVAMHFIPNPKNKPEVNHLGAKTDNRVFMLEWATKRENAKHAREYIVKYGKKIKQIDPISKNVLKIFDTTKDAIQFTGYSEYLFCKHLNTDIEYKGYLWESVNKSENIEYENEIWVSLKDSIYDRVNRFPNYYVSNYGRVKGHLGNILVNNASSTVQTMILTNSKIKHNITIHRLVLMAFNIPNPENKPEIDHLNSDNTDNRLCNLKWATTLENAHNINSLAKKPKRLDMTRINIKVTYPNGKEEIVCGIMELKRKLSIGIKTIRKYAASGKEYNGYKFQIVEKYSDVPDIIEKNCKCGQEECKCEQDINISTSSENSTCINKPGSTMMNIKVTYPDGTEEIIEGLTNTRIKTHISVEKIKENFESTEKYRGYKFELLPNKSMRGQSIYAAKKIKVIYPDNTEEIIVGIINAGKKLRISTDTINKYMDKESYIGYRFESVCDESPQTHFIHTKKLIKVTYSDNTEEIIDGIPQTSKKLSIAQATIKKYALNGEIFRGYKFEILYKS
jgi:hypothetical protein